jgi:hypothetical protein
MTKRVGYKMREAARYVANHPGCLAVDAARFVSPCPRPEQNWAYGYGPVHRAIKAGLIITKLNGRRRELFTPEL